MAKAPVASRVSRCSGSFGDTIVPLREMERGTPYEVRATDLSCTLTGKGSQ